MINWAFMLIIGGLITLSIMILAFIIWLLKKIINKIF